MPLNCRIGLDVEIPSPMPFPWPGLSDESVGIENELESCLRFASGLNDPVPVLGKLDSGVPGECWSFEDAVPVSSVAPTLGKGCVTDAGLIGSVPLASLLPPRRLPIDMPNPPPASRNGKRMLTTLSRVLLRGGGMGGISLGAVPAGGGGGGGGAEEPKKWAVEELMESVDGTFRLVTSV